jgi:hypothetical protein
LKDPTHLLMFKLFTNKKPKKKEKMGWSNVGNLVPKTASCWAFREETLEQNGVVYKHACQTKASSTRRPLLSLFETETETLLLNNLSSPSLHGFLLQTSPRTKSTPLKHSNFSNVTHSLVPIDTTAQGTKKQSLKEKSEFTFPFSSVIFNFL